MRYCLQTTLVLLIVCALPAWAQQQSDRYSLAERYPPEVLRQILTPADDWKPYPTIEERDAWERIPPAVREAHIAKAEGHLGAEWVTMPATVFLEFERNGNRSNYQALSYGRRAQLAELVWGEVYENKGRFLDDIVNGIWSISEETYWGVPAHLDIQEAGYGLPDAAEPTVDLFAAETANLMAWTYYLLGDRLDSVSPLVRPRIRYEVQRRILEPNLTNDDYWWMNFQPNTVINNWNPWVNSNWLTAVLLLEADPDKRVAAVHKILRSLDVFIDYYPSDGGCDEGPVYWTRAAGSLFDVLELLLKVTDGKIDGFEMPLVHEMGKFVYRAYAGNNYFVNFADAAPRVNLDPALLYGYGKRIDDPLLRGFGASFSRKTNLGSGLIPGNFGHLARQLFTLSVINEIQDVQPVEPLPRESRLEDIQVVVARSREGSTNGFFLAAKGGHNDESHNHNDIGNFIVYKNGNPVLIDVGVGEYTKQTFSDDRYSIWSMQSGYHNLPTINGFDQQQGKTFAAKDVEFYSNDRQVQFSLDLAGAYPAEAGVQSWKRTVTLQGFDGVTIRDQYRLSKSTEPVRLNLMTPYEPDTSTPGVIRLTGTVELGPVSVEYDHRRFVPVIEPVQLEDERMRGYWGTTIYRIVLVGKATKATDDSTIRVK